LRDLGLGVVFQLRLERVETKFVPDAPAKSVLVSLMGALQRVALVGPLPCRRVELAAARAVAMKASAGRCIQLAALGLERLS
jgi:hypothetical protein